MSQHDFQLPQQLARRLQTYAGQWMVCGGWAIDLFLHRVTRAHQDIEIAIPRNQQLLMQAYFPAWQWQYYYQHQAIAWKAEQSLSLPIHEIHGRGPAGEKLEVLLNEILEDHWFFRRNPKLSRPLEKACLKSKAGLPILSPEIVLLFKAKGSRPKDEQDFQETLPHLSTEQKQWLKFSLRTQHPNHVWLDSL
ncbi:MAG: hypothetical protein AAFR61_13780 [Bacteroidota bacterium]